MTARATTYARKLGAMLCIVLMGLFAQAAVADAVASVQHLFVGSDEHDHMAFADIVVDFDHHDAGADHDTGPTHDNHHAPSHHHHGAFGLTQALFASLEIDTPRLAPDVAFAGIPVLLLMQKHRPPERPPRA